MSLFPGSNGLAAEMIGNRTPREWSHEPMVDARRLARVITWVLAFFLVTALPLIRAQVPPKADTTLPSAHEIIKRALKRADWIREQGYEDRLTGEHISVKEELDDNKDVKSREEILYRVYPLDGYLYYERLAVDGKPLTKEELKQRKEDFRKKVAASTSGEGEKQDDDNEIKFNEDLISRYEAEVEGVESIDGRPAYVLTFQPKQGKLPVRRRIDHALNSSRGKLWIDKEEFGLVRVQFELFQPVKLWAGILGKVSAITGDLEQTRVADGVWLPRDLAIYLKGRVLFKSFHQQRQLQWRDLKLAPKQVAAK
jgi:hypothetical protein